MILHKKKELNVRDILEVSLGSTEKAEEFAKWAWGEDFRSMGFQTDAVRLWNTLHGKSFKIKGSNSIVEDLKRMIALWKEQ